VVERVRAFADHHLGKGVVIAKDSPNFIGNHIALYGMLQILRRWRPASTRSKRSTRSPDRHSGAEERDLPHPRSRRPRHPRPRHREPSQNGSTLRRATSGCCHSS
jgi:hypothetical protein